MSNLAEILSILKTNLEKGIYNDEIKNELVSVLEPYIHKPKDVDRSTERSTDLDSKYYLTGWFVHNFAEVVKKSDIKEQKIDT